MIQTENNVFVLSTKNTTYAFRKNETGHLEHLYYGRKITVKNCEAIREKYAFAPANSTMYSTEWLGTLGTSKSLWTITKMNLRRKA